MYWGGTVFDENQLKDLLNKYGVDFYNIKSYKRDRILSYGKFDDIEKMLSYLIDVFGVNPSCIEKCPSILYFGVNNVKDNYEYLNSNSFDVLHSTDCLHILSSNLIKLRFFSLNLLRSYHEP